jgi:hypothetical protein
VGLVPGEDGDLVARRPEAVGRVEVRSADRVGREWRGRSQASRERAEQGGRGKVERGRFVLRMDNERAEKGDRVRRVQLDERQPA